MRFVLYNMRYAAGAGRRFHTPFPFAGYVRGTGKNLERIASFLRQLAPDIVGLVEVDLGTYRSRWRNQAGVIAADLGHYQVHESKYCGDCMVRHLPVLNRQGNAFLTSQAIVDARFHRFPSGIKRLVMELELAQVVILLVHLSLKFRHRHDQLRMLRELVAAAQKPVLLAGDFNPLFGEAELDLFLAATGLVNANRWGLPTWPSRAPRRQLDFVLHSPEISVDRLDVPRVRYSDHLPVVCDFHIQKTGGRC